MTNLRFHHLGLATRAIEIEAAELRHLGYRPEGPAFVDVLQGIRGQFMVGPGPRIEVLAPTDGSPVLEPWLAKGIKLYHQAFEVADLDSELARHKAAGAMVVVQPTAAVAFGGRRIAFAMLPSLLLIELIEAHQAARP